MPPRGALVRRMDEGAAAGLAGQVGHKQGLSAGAGQRRQGRMAGGETPGSPGAGPSIIPMRGHIVP